jgi:hypothetical protein
MQPTTPLAAPDDLAPGELTAPSAWPPEQAVLGHLLDAHPRRLDRLALAAELHARLGRPEVETAVTNLCLAGLLEQSAEGLAPAPRVLEFEARLA